MNNQGDEMENGKPVSGAGKRVRVLVVDDEIIAAEGVQDVLG